ncbi:ThuA domain-containing protein [Stieleria sp. ICT_E10.1]|uniref:ThuA domain-containing protein n=1 Tax=Stieleria sedimenti TaxID=2976331 RepID=UPI00217F43A3|nr:ThuA domain-containing protein [Stieleria sedimenti]MCS7466589.1 ThuA domain-containing protein [Stieleria sedimenti]
MNPLQSLSVGRLSVGRLSVGRRALYLFLCGVALISFAAVRPAHAQDKPLKVLLVAGGCCHDYATQTQLLKQGIEKRINAVVTIEFNPSKTTGTRFEVYESEDWAEDYDVILHDECSASVTERPYVDRILAAHRAGVPAVNLHCAMHSYRWGDFRNPVEIGAENAGWYEMIGVQSTGHGPQSPIDVHYTQADHPVTKGLNNWTTINEELYNNVRVFGNTQVLATGDQVQSPRKRDLNQNPNAKPKTAQAVVVWTNLYGPKQTKIFSTTLGHNNETVGDDRYLDLVSRGILWATDNLKADAK